MRHVYDVERVFVWHGYEVERVFVRHGYEMERECVLHGCEVERVFWVTWAFVWRGCCAACV